MKHIIIFLILFIPTICLSDSKITELPEITDTPDSTNLIYIIDDVDSTPVSKSITVDNLLSGIAKDEIFKENPANYIILDEQFDTLNRWVQSGTVGLSNNVVSLTDNNAYIAMMLTDTKQTYVLPVNSPYVIEFTATIAAGQALTMNIGRSSSYMAQIMIYVNAIGLETEGHGTGFEFDIPQNFDMTQKHLVRVLVDPINEDVQTYISYEDTSTGYPEIRETIYSSTFTFDADAAEAVSYINFTNGDNTGVSTVENFRIFKPWMIGIGDSIMVGQPFNWAGVPTLTNNEGASLLYWIEKGVDNKAIIPNQGLGGYTTELTNPRIESMVTDWLPEWVVINIGSNDIILDVPLATMQTNITSIVDACIAANIKVLLFECQPRDVFTSAQNTVKDSWNTWLETFASSRQMCRIVRTHDLLEDPSNPDNMRPRYMADGDGHVNALGAKILGNEAYKVMKDFY